MANRIIDLSQKKSIFDIPYNELTKSTEVYVDLSMRSVYLCNESKNIMVYDTIDQRNGFKVSKSVNVNAVQNAIDNIFNYVPGERILYPEFGSNIRQHLYDGITQHNVEQIIAEINSAFMKFDQRIVVDDIKDVSDIKDTDDNTIVIRIIYHVKNLPQEYYSYDYSYVKA